MNSNNNGNNRLHSDNNIRKRDNTAIASEVSSSLENPSKAPRRVNDDGPPPVDREPKWRKDPSLTYSDWKIEIVDSDQPEAVETFHVHKFVLACGRRRSDYFARLFQMESKFREGESCTSRIELEPLAAKAFPQLLDYVYAYEKPLDITVESATALHHLGEYFEMQNLRWDVKQYCREEMTVDNVHVIYRHAVHFQDVSFLNMVAQFLGQHIVEVDPKDCKIMCEPDPELWINVLRNVPDDDEEAVLCSSKIIARFVDDHWDHLDRATFQRLTQETMLPAIHCNAALALCKFDDRFEENDKEAKNDESESKVGPGIRIRNRMSTLQERCASSLAALDVSQWDSFLASEHKIDKLRVRKASFLVDLLVKVLREASAKQKEYVAEIEAMRNILQNFRPVRCGRIVKKPCSPLRPDEIIEVPADLQWARPDLGDKLSYGYQESLFPNSSMPCLPAFYYDPTSPVEDSDHEGEAEEEEEEQEQANAAVLQHLVARLQAAAMPEQAEEEEEDVVAAV